MCAKGEKGLFFLTHYSSTRFYAVAIFPACFDKFYPRKFNHSFGRHFTTWFTVRIQERRNYFPPPKFYLLGVQPAPSNDYNLNYIGWNVLCLATRKRGMWPEHPKHMWVRCPPLFDLGAVHSPLFIHKKRDGEKKGEINPLSLSVLESIAPFT